MVKVIVNNCWGGYSLSDEAIRRFHELTGITTTTYSEVERTNPFLVQVVEELGDAANGRNAKLCILEIPDEVSWEISDYDGMEHITQVHQTWYP